MIEARNQMSNEMWNSYVSHLEKRSKEEKEYFDHQKESNQTYKESLIENILKSGKCRLPIEELKRMTIRSLERIEIF